MKMALTRRGRGSWAQQYAEDLGFVLVDVYACGIIARLDREVLRSHCERVEKGIANAIT